MDKFTKWIEAKPIRKCDGATALKFVKELVVRFGLPHSIITDNGINFAHGELEQYCHEQGIRLDLASVAHPQSNGQVERANGLILSGLKPRLETPLHRAAGAWVEELSSVLWSLRTTPNRSTGFTPFSWSMGRKQSCLQISSTIPPEFPPTTKKMLKSHNTFLWICLKRHVS